MIENMADLEDEFGFWNKYKAYRKRNHLSWKKSLLYLGLAGVLLYGSYVTKPFWESKKPIPSEENIAVEMRQAENVCNRINELGIDLGKIDWEKPNAGLSEHDYNLLCNHLNSTIEYLSLNKRVLSLSGMLIGQSVPAGKKDPPQSIYEYLADFNKHAKERLDKEFFTGTREVLERLQFPSSAIGKFDKKLFIARTNRDFFKGKRLAQLEAGDLIYSSCASGWDSPESIPSLAHEAVEAIYPFYLAADDGERAKKDIIKKRVVEDILLPKFANRELRRKLEKKAEEVFSIDNVHAGTNSRNDELKKQCYDLSLFSFSEEVNYHQANPEEIIKDYLAHVALRKSGFNVAEKMLDEETTGRMKNIFDNVLGQDWDKDWVSFKPKQIGEIIPYDRNNAMFFARRRAGLSFIYDVPRFVADKLAESRVAYLDYSQKFGWWAEESPVEAYGAFGLGLGAAGLGMWMGGYDLGERVARKIRNRGRR